MTGFTRRQLLLAAASAGAGALTTPWLSRSVLAANTPVVAALFCGHIDDNGFMQAGYQGFKKATDQLPITGHYKDQVANETQAQIAALRELEAVLKAHGAHNYSIFLHPETRQLFAYVEIEDEARWNAIARTEVCQRWWKHMGDVMPSNPDHSPTS